MISYQKIINSIKEALRNTRRRQLKAWSFLYVKIYLIILILLNISLWTLASFFYSRINEDIVALHYNVDFGINLIGDSRKLYIIPALGLAIIIINFFLVAFTVEHKDKKFIAHLLLAAALIANYTLIAAIFTIYLINFR